MLKVMFVCLGNICRSPMAEFIFKDLVKKKGLENKFQIISRATSTEALGNPVYGVIKKRLLAAGITCDEKRAAQITQEEYDEYDYIVYMDDSNYNNLRSSLSLNKDKIIYKLLVFAGQKRDVVDPWYTGDAETTYNDLTLGCGAMLDYIIKKHNLMQ